MKIALTRAVPSSIANCELTHVQREPIDVERARQQHAHYEATLRTLGCLVERIADADRMPDSVFVEDAAVVFDEIAVITRPGAESRRPETDGVEQALVRHRQLRHITAPATIDGGDVLRCGHDVFIGVSTRTNAAAVEQMREFLAPFGYRVTPVDVGGVLHLKSAVTETADGVLLINRTLVSAEPFAGYELVDVDPSEPMAANILRVGERCVFPVAFPRTLERLEARGITPVVIDASELAKAEGALTCCSLIF